MILFTRPQYNRHMDKDNPKQPPNPLQNFTNAVKTIVNVPKSDVAKSDAHNHDHKYKEWKCPDCGKTYVKRTQRKHEG